MTSVKPALEPISLEMARDGWGPTEVTHACNLALEVDDVYYWAIAWFAHDQGSVERDKYRWLIGDVVDDHLAVYGRIPSLQFLRGICG